MSRLRGNETGALCSESLWLCLSPRVPLSSALSLSLCPCLSFQAYAPGLSLGGQVAAARGTLFQQSTLEFLNYRGLGCFSFTSSPQSILLGQKKFIKSSVQAHTAAFTPGL